MNTHKCAYACVGRCMDVYRYLKARNENSYAMHQEGLDPNFLSWKERMEESMCLHRSAGPQRGDYKGMKRQGEAVRRARIAPFISLQRRVTSPICKPVWARIVPFIPLQRRATSPICSPVSDKKHTAISAVC